METKLVHVAEKKLVGFSMLTNNATELNPATNKIGPFIQKYYQNNLAERIPYRTNPGVLYAAYYNYSSDEHGDYRYFIGEEVSEIAHEYPADMNAVVIPAGNFFCMTTDKGPMPKVVVDAWQMIWKMTPEEMGGKRHYLVDFEVYDQRVADPNNAQVDIYIGLIR